MGYWLGIDLGSTFTAAAVCRGQDGRWGPPEVVGLGDRSAAVSSVVFLGDAGQLVVGEAAERRALTDPDRVARGFKRRIGDDVPLVIGGVSYAAPEIAAMVVRWVVERVAAREGGPATRIVLTHPAGWGTYKVDVLARALRAADLGQVEFVTEPEAAAAGYAAQERIETGSTVAVYDLGGGTFDAAVVRKTDAGGFRVLGQPQGLEQLGGVDFDDAVFAHVLAAVPQLAELDGQDPAVLTAIAALRRECTEAKEALSVDTEVTIPVLAPGIQSQVRMIRAEFEDMIHTGVCETVQALCRTLRSAHLEAAELDVVLLVGGSSRVPLVAQLVSAELGRPVAVDADPKAAIALGAALLARPVESPADPSASNPPPPTTTAEPPPERPSRTAVSVGTEAADLEVRRTSSRRVRQVALAGALALATAAGVASIPFLTAHSDPTPPAGSPPADVPPGNGAVPPPGGPPMADPREGPASIPGGANPSPNAGQGGDPTSRRTGSGGVVRTTPPAAPILPSGGGTAPDPPAASRAPAPSWVTTHTWSRSWSNPPPTTAPTSTSPPPTSPPPTSPPPTTPPPTSAPPTSTPAATREAPSPTPTSTTAPPAAATPSRP